MAETASDSSRTWRGQTTQERQSERRDRLIEAGIELFGTRGYANTPVKAICEEAGLTERYFYEAFEDREALLDQIYEILIADCRRGHRGGDRELARTSSMLRCGPVSTAFAHRTDPGSAAGPDSGNRGGGGEPRA